MISLLLAQDNFPLQRCGKKSEIISFLLEFSDTANLTFSCTHMKAVKYTPVNDYHLLSVDDQITFFVFVCLFFVIYVQSNGVVLT